MSTKYQDLAARTVSPNFYPASVPGTQLLGLLELTSIVGEFADRQKRAFFYGKPYESDTRIESVGEEVASELPLAQSPRYSENLLHALLGVISEAAEVADALLDSMKTGEDLDLVNLAEEAGDLRWYLALMATALNKDEAEIEAANIAKLRARFPDKFTEDAATDRDLDHERQVLETGLDLTNLKAFFTSQDLGIPGDTVVGENAPACCGRTWEVEVLLNNHQRESWDIDCAGMSALNAGLERGFLEIYDLDVHSAIVYPLTSVIRFEIAENGSEG